MRVCQSSWAGDWSAALSGNLTGFRVQIPSDTRPHCAALGPPSGEATGFGRIDAAGRVADRAVISALGWRPGDRLTLTAAAGMVIARHDPDGMVLAHT